MKDVLKDVDAWTARGDKVALAGSLSLAALAPIALLVHSSRTGDRAITKVA